MANMITYSLLLPSPLSMVLLVLSAMLYISLALIFFPKCKCILLKFKKPLYTLLIPAATILLLKVVVVLGILTAIPSVIALKTVSINAIESECNALGTARMRGQ